MAPASQVLLARCAGLQHGGICEELCEAPLTGSAKFLCSQGRWQLQSECLTVNASSAKEAAVQVLLGLNLELDGSSELTGLAWAQSNEENLLRAFAARLGVHPAQLRMELLEGDSLQPLRRLTTLSASDSAFAVRITLLLGQEASAEDLEEAAQELAAVADSQALLEVLANQTEAGEDSTQIRSLISAVLSQPAILREYTLPAAAWIVGAWDSVCDILCAQDAEHTSLQTREVRCSRGRSIGCLGPAAIEAGPKPAEVRPCECGDLLVSQASWALPLLLAACICCSCCGGCCGYVLLLRHAGAPKSGARRLRALGLNAGFHVGEASAGDWQLPRSETLEDQELGETSVPDDVGRRRSSKLSLESASETKAHVVWSVDLEEVSQYFARQGSVLWQQRSLRSQSSLQSCQFQQPSIQQPPEAERMAWKPQQAGSAVLLGATDSLPAKLSSLGSETVQISQL